MGIRKSVTISWSGGKDSALALYKIMSSPEYEVENLHTVIDEASGRVGLHGIRESVIEQQAEYIGLPLVKVYLRASQTHNPYEQLMRSFYRQCGRQRIEGIVFGDIFLQDLRDYRLKLLQHSGLEPFFPLWGIEPKVLYDDFINLGFKALICSADASLFSSDVLGKTLDHEFARSLPPNIDICGERGEYHTVVSGGPIMKKKIELEKGKLVKKRYRYKKQNEFGQQEEVEKAFWFQDLLP